MGRVAEFIAMMVGLGFLVWWGIILTRGAQARIRRINNDRKQKRMF